MMRILIVEDDFGSRRYLQMLLQSVGRCDVVVDGNEAIEAFRMAWEDGEPYHLILLDIMMPNKDGQTALTEIRNIEREMGIEERNGVKVIMTTALEDPRNVVHAYYHGAADSYLVKPIKQENLFRSMKELGLAVE